MVAHSPGCLNFRLRFQPYQRSMYVVLICCQRKLSNLVKANAPNVALEKYEDLENYMKGLIERHVELVPPGLGSREKLRAEIINGMTATWHLCRLSSNTNGEHRVISYLHSCI